LPKTSISIHKAMRRFAPGKKPNVKNRNVNRMGRKKKT